MHTVHTASPRYSKTLELFGDNDEYRNFQQEFSSTAVIKGTVNNLFALSSLSLSRE